MQSPRAPHHRTWIGIAAIALLAAACGGSTAPTASTSVSPAAVATASPAATPAATASAAAGSPGADAAASLSIAPPYTLAPLDAAQAGQVDQVKNALGAMSSVVQLGVREVKKGGTNDGVLLAMAFPGVPVPGFLDAFAASAGGADAKVTSRTIGGQDVKLIEGTATHVAAYAHGSTMVFVYGQSADETLAIVTAVIQASE